MKSIVEGLNPAQKDAVETLSGPLLVLAGAGSGKTKVLTHRIANLIQHGVEPGRILAVTFTNKAAREMRERLWKLLDGAMGASAGGPDGVVGKATDAGGMSAGEAGVSSGVAIVSELKNDAPIGPPRSFMPYMGTFHGICVRILHMEAAAARLAPNFTIYDADDQITLIRRIIKETGWNSDKNLKPKSVQSVISMEKNQGTTPDEYMEKAVSPVQKRIGWVFRRYEEEKQNAAALDFDDLLLKTLELFTNNLEVRKKWQKRFLHILIDEYQDTNTIQYQLVKLLVNKERNICVVGDDWQSIYSWRGADFTNILNFERDFPGAKVVKLEQNYRSTGNILKASQEIINKNKTRTEKTLFTEAGDGEPVEIETLRDETAEATFVVMKITQLQKEYPDFADFAILYRTNAQSYTFEKTLIEMHVPYKIVGGVRFYDRKEVKDVLAILKLIVNERDKVSLERVARNVLPGVGAGSVTKLFAAMDAVDDAEPLKDPDVPEAISNSKARKSVEKLCRFLKEMPPDENPGETARRVVEVFDFQTLTDDGTPNGEERMNNLEVLANNAHGYDRLGDFLADAMLMSSADEATGTNAVTLMTMHAAKGLEFPVVFMVGMEDGLFPSARAADEIAQLEEERRLAYVGMTRAMRRLILTYATSRYSFGTRNYSMPSRFLLELGYIPYGSSGYQDKNEFSDEDFEMAVEYDPFPEDVPVYE